LRRGCERVEILPATDIGEIIRAREQRRAQMAAR